MRGCSSFVRRCGSFVDSCGSLWIVLGRCGTFRVLVTTLDRNPNWFLHNILCFIRKELILLYTGFSSNFLNIESKKIGR